MSTNAEARPRCGETEHLEIFTEMDFSSSPEQEATVDDERCAGGLLCPGCSEPAHSPSPECYECTNPFCPDFAGHDPL